MPGTAVEPPFQQTTVSTGIGEREWDAVRTLIDQVREDQSRDAFVTSFVEWRLAVRQFRRVEMSRIVLGEPTEDDHRWYSICLYLLLAMGETVELWLRDLEPEPLVVLNVTRGDILACVEELRLSAREINHGFTDTEVEATKKLIFGAA